MLRLGLLSKRYRAHSGQKLLVEACELLRDFKEVPSTQAVCVEKPLKVACADPQVGRVGVSGNQQGWVNCVNQVDGNSDFAQPEPADWVGEQ